MQGEDPETRRGMRSDEDCTQTHKEEQSKLSGLELSAEECTSMPFEKGWDIMFH